MYNDKSDTITTYQEAVIVELVLHKEPNNMFKLVLQSFVAKYNLHCVVNVKPEYTRAMLTPHEWMNGHCTCKLTFHGINQHEINQRMAEVLGDLEICQDLSITSCTKGYTQDIPVEQIHEQQGL